MAGRLFKDSRESLAFARAAGSDTVTVLLAVDADRVSRVCDRVSRLSGSVVRRHDEIGYVRAVVRIERVEELVADDAVGTASVMATHHYTPVLSMPREDDTPAAPTDQSSTASLVKTGTRLPRLPDPIATPYSPLTDLAATGFLAEHPTWDGRGVTVAIIDGFIDQLLPEFQTATAIDGTPVPKILDYVNPLDPRLDWGPEWVTDWQQVTTIDGMFTVDGQTFIAPHDGTFQLGFLDESRLHFGRHDLTRDGNPDGSGPLYGVLWDKTDNTVWVDTDQDLSFADERPMTDYRVRQDIGIFGDADSKPPVRESVMFTVQTLGDRDAVAINVGGGSHGTAIAGATFGSRGKAGRYDGIAPGAQIVSVCPYPGDVRNSTATMIEALIAAMSDPRVDLVVYEPHAQTVFEYLPKDGASITSVLATRLVEAYGKPLFVPASNLPWLNQAWEESVGDGLIGVGGYQSQECYRINDGILVPERDNLHWASSHGPAGDGGVAPLLLAPSNLLSSRLGFDEKDLPGPHQLPGGYGIAGGTSTATPSAAAAAALLISAAKQSGVSYDAGRLRRALCASARFLPHIPAHCQGHGLIQVDAAWQALCELAERDRGPRITASAPVHTTISAHLNEPDRGRGLYEREGWAVGARETRTIALTRTAGDSRPLTFEVSWLGNEHGTFSSAETVTLPRNEPVELAVTIAPNTPGVHSATLLLRDASVPLDEHRVLATVVVPEHDLTDRHIVEAEVEFRTAYPGATFFRVPAGTKALLVDGEAAGHPPWVTPPHGGALGNESPDAWTHDGRTRRTWSYPPPGVWEVAYVDRAIHGGPARHRVIEAKPTMGSVTATSFAVDVNPSPPAQFQPGTGTRLDLRVDLTNRQAGFTGGVRSGPLGAARARTTTITEGQMRVCDLDVPTGSEALLVAVEAADGDADLDLYLFDCTEKTPRLVKKHTSVPSGGVLYTEDPAPGSWKVVIDAYAAPHGSTTYHYLDVITNPRFGSLSTADVPTERAPHEKWDLTAHVWFAESPKGDRVPTALLLVTSDDVRQQLPPTQTNPEESIGAAPKPEPHVDHVPLGWAAALFETAGVRLITG